MEKLTLETDLKARLCVIASMLYYGLDVTFMPDTAYDQMSKHVSEHFKLLTPMRRWQLGSAEEIASSGFQCKVTRLTADAALWWMVNNRIPMQSPSIMVTRPWRLSKVQGLAYLHTNEFRWSYE